jgi:antitoxin component HigA of HigAB toxin-antitoxin module
MTDIKTKFEEFIQDAGRHRIFEQESLAIEATELICTLMKERKMQKSDLAQRIGKSKAYVTQVLSGSRNMTLHTFADLAFALGHKVELHSSSLSKSSEVVLYKNVIQMRNNFLRKVPQSWIPGMEEATTGLSEDSCLAVSAHVA